MSPDDKTADEEATDQQVEATTEAAEAEGHAEQTAEGTRRGDRRPVADRRRAAPSRGRARARARAGRSDVAGVGGRAAPRPARVDEGGPRRRRRRRPHHRRQGPLGAGHRRGVARRGHGRPQPPRLHLVHVPVGHRLAAVALRPQRGRARSTPPTERDTDASSRAYAGGETRFQMLAAGRRTPSGASASPSRPTSPTPTPGSTRSSPSTPAPTGTSARPGRCTASPSWATPPRAHLPAGRRSRGTRCARTSRSWPARSSRGRASSTSSPCPTRATTTEAAEDGATRRDGEEVTA